MSFSELFRMAKMKSDSSQSYGMDNDCLELVWENGPIVMQGQSSKDKKESALNNFRSLVACKSQDGKDSSNPKMDKFGTTADSVTNDFPLSAPSCPVALDQDDDLVPWLNYSVDEPLSNDYCPDFLSDLSGLTRNDVSKVNNLVSSGKRSSFSNNPWDDHTNSVANATIPVRENISKSSLHALEFDGLRTSQELPQHTISRLGTSVVANSIAGSVQHIVDRDSFCSSSPVGSASGPKSLKHDAGHPNNHFGFMNFSNFSRPAAAPRVSPRAPRNPGSGSIPNGAERLRTEDKDCSLSSSIPNEQNFGNSCSQKEMPPLKQLFSGSGRRDQPSSFCNEKTATTDKLPNIAISVLGSKVAAGEQKIGDPAVATSSVCSGNSLERASNDPKVGLKRQMHEMGESEDPSDEADEESVGIRKVAPARAGTKRSRAAEVHNLSERRRRDRINEKMRALQELIPNCNKADKASMLDEAIEYLKTLQLQVQLQIMSMGAGLYIPPPMMLPGGMQMQHIHGAHVPHFSPMGVVGMGMGFGMNMLDVNSGMTQVSPIQGPHYPMPCPSNFHGMMGPSLQPFGHPGQGMMPMPVPRASLVPFSGGPPLNVPMGLNISRMAGPANASNLTPTIGTQGMPTNNMGVSANQPTNQATNKSTVEPPSALGRDQAKAINNTETSNPVDRSDHAHS